jgi:hypothetical protein
LNFPTQVCPRILLNTSLEIPSTFFHRSVAFVLSLFV